MLKDTSAMRLTDRMDMPSTSIFRICTRLSVVNLFMQIIILNYLTTVNSLLEILTKKEDHYRL